jgi:carboxypeptidase C (cathepsin A)
MNDLEMAPLRALAKLQHAMREDPSLRVMMAIGYYDFTCPYFGIKTAVGQLEPDLRARVTVTYYHAGHFLLPEARPAVASFIHSTLATSGKND